MLFNIIKISFSCFGLWIFSSMVYADYNIELKVLNQFAPGGNPIVIEPLSYYQRHCVDLDQSDFKTAEMVARNESYTGKIRILDSGTCEHKKPYFSLRIGELNTHNAFGAKFDQTADHGLVSHYFDNDGMRGWMSGGGTQYEYHVGH